MWILVICCLIVWKSFLHMGVRSFLVFELVCKFTPWASKNTRAFKKCVKDFFAENKMNILCFRLKFPNWTPFTMIDCFVKIIFQNSIWWYLQCGFFACSYVVRLWIPVFLLENSFFRDGTADVFHFWRQILIFYFAFGMAMFGKCFVQYDCVEFYIDLYVSSGYKFNSKFLWGYFSIH